jgi:predicted Zn-dependent protease
VPLAAAALLGVAAAYALLPESEASLSSEIHRLVRSGDLVSARTRLDGVARRRPGDPFVEKLRGDVACARGSRSECLRRYRAALAARPGLREDETLRENTRALLGRRSSCGDRRAAAELLAELRDPGALPALEEARRGAGFFGFFCTGDAIDRAIQTTRAAARGPRTGQ